MLNQQPRPPVTRRVYSLTDAESVMLKLYQQRWSAISARRFWERVAAARGVDPGSIIHITIPGEAYSRAFSALPEGHDKPWCWPIYPLKCERTAEEIGYE